MWAEFFGEKVLFLFMPASKLSSRLSSYNTGNETCNTSTAERDTSNTWKQFISDQYFQRYHQINSSILVYLSSQHIHTFHFEWLFELNVLQSPSLVVSSTSLWFIWYQSYLCPLIFLVCLLVQRIRYERQTQSPSKIVEGFFSLAQLLYQVSREKNNGGDSITT